MVIVIRKTQDQSQNDQRKSSGKNKFAYMKHIKYSDATWTSYLCQSI